MQPEHQSWLVKKIQALHPECEQIKKKQLIERLWNSENVSTLTIQLIIAIKQMVQLLSKATEALRRERTMLIFLMYFMIKLRGLALNIFEPITCWFSLAELDLLEQWQPYDKVKATGAFCKIMNIASLIEVKKWSGLCIYKVCVNHRISETESCYLNWPELKILLTKSFQEMLTLITILPVLDWKDYLG